MSRPLAALGLLLLFLYGAVLGCSFAFVPEASDPPLPAVLLLLGAATLVYYAAVWLVLRERQDSPATLRLIVCFALLFRLVLLPSRPIQETDYYRYLWDGRVTLHGHNPYHYSPWQIESWGADAGSSELGELFVLAGQTDAVQTIFERVHHRQVPAIYPPLAQLIFAGCALVTPAAAPLWLHLLVLKIVLIGFDLAALLVLAALLRRLGLPACWCLVYGWCPLVLKEFANSAHLDAIAVCLTMLALYALVRVCLEPQAQPGLRWGCLAGAALGLAVLAKTYPVLLVPLAAGLLIGRLDRLAWLPVAVAVLVIVAGYLPFGVLDREPAVLPARLEGDRDLVEAHHPGSGLATFLSSWETNDLLFTIVYDNLKPPAEETPWFVVLPESGRHELHQWLVEPLAGAIRLPAEPLTSFLLTQLLMGSIVLGLAARCAWQCYRRPEPLILLRGAFCVLAWSWLLSSTQNPWYVTWFLPLLVFARARSWYLLPGLVLLYYLGFWLDRQPSLAGLNENLVWLEYVPFYIALAAETAWFTFGAGRIDFRAPNVLG